MAHQVCPWWLGYFLTSPLRRWLSDPADIVAPYVREGMTVLEPGPGMGFFTLEMARRVGPAGRIVAVDVQPKMLEKLKQRATKAGIAERVDARLATSDSLGIRDLKGIVDFALVFAVVHEVPSPGNLFMEMTEALRPGALLLLAEPKGHVKQNLFESELEDAAKAGLTVVDRPAIRRSLTALLKK